MGIKTRDAGNVLRTVTRIRMRDAGNVLRTIQRVRIRDAGNVLRTVWVAMTAAVAPGSASGSILGQGFCTTSSVTASPSGGTPGYSYAWSYVSGSVFTVDSPTLATTTFTTFLEFFQVKSGIYRCTITDSNGATASANVSVSASESS